MYYSPGYTPSGYAGAAMKRYAAVQTGSRVEGATPHELVRILFDELMMAMESCSFSLTQGDFQKANDKQVRALSILYALDNSLDFDKGGDVAISLAQIYREARRLLILAQESRDPAHVRTAHAVVAEIAGAWNQIIQ